MAHAIHHRLETRISKRKTVDKSRRKSVRLAGRDILGVRRDDLRLHGLKRVCNGKKGLVLPIGGECAHLRRRGAGIDRQSMYCLCCVHAVYYTMLRKRNTPEAQCAPSFRKE